MSTLDTFESNRALLFSIAYRMLGSVADAEDMVQETYLRWQTVSLEDVESPKAYLSSVITRLCIDQLRSAREKREQYIGPWLPEPIVVETEMSPGDQVAFDESLTTAFLMLLETLTPQERAVFLLREVFDYDYAEIASIVGKTEVACRQLAHRAKVAVKVQRPRQPVSREEQEQVLTRFFAACTEGNMEGLLSVLAEQSVSWSDGGGKVKAALRPIYGAQKVARFFSHINDWLTPGTQFRFATVNGLPGLIAIVDGRADFVTSFEISGGKIDVVYSTRNPDKLRHVKV